MRTTKKRTLTPAHKRALARGRTAGAAVDAYLQAINTPKRRGRPVSAASLRKRLADAKARFLTASGVQKLTLAQEIRDLEQRLANAVKVGDAKALEAEFVKHAKAYGESKGIGYAAWREGGVSPAVLKKAGINRST